MKQLLTVQAATKYRAFGTIVQRNMSLGGFGEMERVRVGVVGLGGMGRKHAQYLANGVVPNAELVAVCDMIDASLKWARESLGDSVALYKGPDEFFRSKSFDGVLIATPHYFHTELAIKAFSFGYHVLVEKPAGVYTKQVREMNDAAEKAGTVFGIMYNERTNPLFQKVRDLVQSNELGEIKRTNWIDTDCYRSQSYYDSGSWRASWAGEGGGVLLNQSPHQIDVWQWSCGMPKRVRSFCGFGKYHDIEVEDAVTAYVEYENGASGVFITGTGEAPGTNRFEVTGDRGKLVLEDGRLTFWRLRIPERQFNREYKGGFGKPECWKCEIPVNGVETSHPGITRNWVESILTGSSLLAPGVEGIRGVGISNAILLSSWLDELVDLPVDEETYYRELQKRIEKSKS